jgi:hypothetical protein
LHHRFAALAGALLLTFSTAVPAEEQAAPDPRAERSQQFVRLWGEGAYLKAIAAIEDGWESRQDTMWYNYTQYRPALDGFVVMTEDRRRPVPPVDAADLARYDHAEAVDAIAAIVERAATTRVVIVNETHDNPRDRAFVLAVAGALRPLGYAYYAAETFASWGNEEQKAERLSRMVASGYPYRDSGTYSSEPMFANLIRSVLALGYRPVAYEFSPTDWPTISALSREQQVEMREQAQTENLARAIGAARPQAKFLIHVGYSHAAERPIGPAGHKQEWMAARLARMTGIDPLTIDQVDLSEYSANPSTRALHAALAERVGERPTVFLAGGQPIRRGVNAEATDLQVVHPPIRRVHGRPDWLARTGRQAIAIPAELLPRTGRRLIQVFAAAEGPEAIPVDQALVNAGTEPPVLYVPAGTPLRWATQGDS